MLAMTTEQLAPLDVSPSAIGVLDLADRDIPYVDLTSAAYPHAVLSVAGLEYTFQRSFPVKGYGAVMPAVIDELLGAGKRILVAERSERYYVYVA